MRTIAVCTDANMENPAKTPENKAPARRLST
jgi:hypothetical protein